MDRRGPDAFDLAYRQPLAAPSRPEGEAVFPLVAIALAVGLARAAGTFAATLPDATAFSHGLRSLIGVSGLVGALAFAALAIGTGATRALVVALVAMALAAVLAIVPEPDVQAPARLLIALAVGGVTPTGLAAVGERLGRRPLAVRLAAIALVYAGANGASALLEPLVHAARPSMEGPAGGVPALLVSLALLGAAAVAATLTVKDVPPAVDRPIAPVVLAALGVRVLANLVDGPSTLGFSGATYAAVSVISSGVLALAALAFLGGRARTGVFRVAAIALLVGAVAGLAAAFLSPAWAVVHVAVDVASFAVMAAAVIGHNPKLAPLALAGFPLTNFVAGSVLAPLTQAFGTPILHGVVAFLALAATGAALLAFGDRLEERAGLDLTT